MLLLKYAKSDGTCLFNVGGYPLITIHTHANFIVLRGRDPAQVVRALCCKGFDLPAWRIDPVWCIHLQFGIFSIVISGPQLVRQSLQYMLFCLWQSAIAAYQKEQPIMW